MRVRFSRFWKGFKPEDSFFVRALNYLGHETTIVRSRRRPVDLEFVSVFPGSTELLFRKILSFTKPSPRGLSEVALRNTSNDLRVSNSQKLIWYTGENIRVPADAECSFSYDQDDFHGTNVYFPLWYSSLNWFGEKEFNFRAGVDVRASDLIEPRKLSKIPDKFACAFIGNPHPLRTRAAAELARYGTVDLFGKSVGKPIKYKSSIATDYKFMVCFENDLYPGYVTEKLLDAYVSGCVPLYWGDLGSETSINRDCFINLKDFNSLQEFAQYVAGISDAEYKKLFEQPFLSEVPDLSKFFRALSS